MSSCQDALFPPRKRKKRSKPRMQYIVMERGYEYNDEWYVPQESGEPKLVFSDRTQAEAAAYRLNAKAKPVEVEPGTGGENWIRFYVVEVPESENERQAGR